MAHYGTLGTFRFTGAAADTEDIRGAHLYGRDDEKLGKIDDVIFAHSSGDIRYAVVDTGGWLSSKKFLVPAERLRASTRHENDFEATLDKKQIESFPPYNEADLKDDKRWGDYEGRYRSQWSDDTIMHREETDRNITPTTAQMTKGTGATGPMQAGSDKPVSRPVDDAELNSRVIPATGSEVQITSNAMGISPRWSNFEQRLRERRKEATYSCVTCNLENRPTASERERDERKAG